MPSAATPKGTRNSRENTQRGGCRNIPLTAFEWEQGMPDREEAGREAEVEYRKVI